MTRYNFDQRFHGHKVETNHWKRDRLVIIYWKPAALTAFRTNCSGHLGVLHGFSQIRPKISLCGRCDEKMNCTVREFCRVLQCSCTSVVPSIVYKVKWSRYRPVWPRRWVEVQLYSSMTAAPEGGEWPAARPGRTYPRERTGTYCTGGWVDPRAGLDGRELSSPPGFDLGPSRP